SLRDALNVPGDQQLSDWLELIGVAARLRQRVEHDVDARNEPRAVAFLRRRKRDGRRCLALEIPHYAMQPRTRGTLDRAHRVAAHVADHDLRPRATIAAAGREAIYDLRAVLRTRRAERLLSSAAASQRRLPVLIGRRRLEEIGAGGDRAVIQLLERRDVHDPQRAAVRRRDQVAVARMNAQIVYRHRREASHEALPRPAPIERDVETDVGAHE